MNAMIAYPGNDSPLGLKTKEKKSNFALFSRGANKVKLGLFSSEKSLIQEFPMHRTGDVWHICLRNVPENSSYAFQIDANNWVLDPYLKEESNPFDWEGIPSPKTPLKDLVIYEMHVRGFTKHSSSQAKHPGTFLGIIEKIPHLKKLGVNALELMPIFEFDEMHSKTEPNYWGYNTLSYRTLMRKFAASDSPINEFKSLVKELHKNGIEVILDVVFNHTAEESPFHIIDPKTYYMLDDNGHYKNYSGCGNTLNCNHPAVQKYILDCLEYWIDEMHVDGFRFDLASIFTRDLDGNEMDSPPIVDAITKLCSSKNVKLIAEAWDAAGLYQVGLFPNKWKHWSDWNGNYRDSVRRFIKGTPGSTKEFADSLNGSPSIYEGGPLGSINFITAHDGYTLRDLVSYQEKHNLANGENNQDGSNHNESWNCGHEGPTSDPNIIALRERQMRNFFLALFLSQGIPMLLMGDEYGHSRNGNNNPFVQDNECNWFCWDTLKKNEKIFSFVSDLIAFRKKYLSTEILTNWKEDSQFLSFHLKDIYAAFNAHNHPVTITLPSEGQWRKILQTEEDWDIHLEQVHLLPEKVELCPYSALLAYRRH